MNNLTALLLSMTMIVALRAHPPAPSYQWARSMGDIGRDIGRAICTDQQGNVIVAGYFQEKITLFQTSYQGRGMDDLLLIKLDASGNIIWAKTAGGPLSDMAYGVATDRSGNIYLTGTFDSMAFFDNKVLFSYGKTDAFLAKYSPDGEIIWVQKAGGPDTDAAMAVAVDKEGSAYITGRFERFAAFGTTIITSSGFFDVFFAKYHRDGTLAWVKKAGGIKEDVGLGIAVDTFGNCYATGYFNETIDFQTDVLTTPSVSSEIFIVKIDSMGKYDWARQAGSLRGDAAYAIAVDEQRNSYITGYFADRAYFGQHTLEVVAYNDLFVAKYNAKGICLWARSAGGRLLDIGTGIAVAKDGSVYVTGIIDSTVFFESDTIFLSQRDDTFIAKWDRQGNYQWVKPAGGPNSQIGMAICTDHAAHIYLTGYYYNKLVFDDTTLTQQQDADIFVAQLFDPDLTLQVMPLTRHPWLRIYPNPAHHLLTLRPASYQAEKHLLRIMDTFGNVWWENSIVFVPEQEVSLDISGWKKGIYFLHISDEKQAASYRFMISR